MRSPVLLQINEWRKGSGLESRIKSKLEIDPAMPKVTQIYRSRCTSQENSFFCRTPGSTSAWQTTSSASTAGGSSPNTSLTDVQIGIGRLITFK